MAGIRVFGEIPGVTIGTCFPNRLALHKAGVHKPTQAGISGSGAEGADSVVVSGGYADDQDFKDVIVYTGQGGRNENGVHVKDQELILGNRALVTSEIEGMPVRVIRGDDRKNPFAPLSGYRYDGLFRVDSHWHELGKAGFKVWRYRLVQIEADIATTHLSVMQPLAIYGDGNTSPNRKLSMVHRIIRDTKQAKVLKKHYKHACQICRTQIITAGGPYAEAAHIRPLGAPHNGPDTQNNILCLCPNHHVMFDLGTFSIADDHTLLGIEGHLFVNAGHDVSATHLAYHRTHYLNLPNSKL